nr:TIGR00295 family protein [Methanolobus psychrotolerans]
MLSREDALHLLKVSGCSEKVISHCITVADVALEIASKLKVNGKDVDIELVEIGGLLHDIGRAKSHGIDHALAGVDIAKENNLEPRIMEIIKRHIGAGITREEAKKIGLPDEDYMPVTLEQKIVAHADNLVMGTERISLDRCLRKMQEKHVNIESIERVKVLAEEIGIY